VRDAYFAFISVLALSTFTLSGFYKMLEQWMALCYPKYICIVTVIFLQMSNLFESFCMWCPLVAYQHLSILLYSSK
jgi:hypothetical protein